MPFGFNETAVRAQNVQTHRGYQGVTNQIKLQTPLAHGCCVQVCHEWFVMNEWV